MALLKKTAGLFKGKKAGVYQQAQTEQSALEKNAGLTRVATPEQQKAETRSKAAMRFTKAVQSSQVSNLKQRLGV